MSEPFLLHFTRAQMLLERRRFEEARKELLACLKENPMFGAAYSLYALCLCEDPTQIEKAVQAARKGISLDPESAFAYYCMSISLLSMKNYGGAENAIRKAIEIEPEDADYHGLLGSIFFSQNRLRDAKAQFESALVHDADHQQSLAALSQIESQLGHRKEAEELANRVVQNAPEDADAHSARGWACIYSNRPKEAFECFREALRLDPNNANARAGLVHSLKMHNFFFRNYFALCAKMNRFSGRYQWGLIIGLIVLYNVMLNLLRHFTALSSILFPLIVLYLAFCLFSWIVGPLTSFLLLFSRWGRLASTFREKATGIIFITCVLFGLGAMLLPAPYGSPVLQEIGFGSLLVCIPLTFAIKTEEFSYQLFYAGYTLLMCVFIGLLILTENGVFFLLTVLMLFAFQFIANHIAIRQNAPRF